MPLRKALTCIVHRHSGRPGRDCRVHYIFTGSCTLQSLRYFYRLQKWQQQNRGQHHRCAPQLLSRLGCRLFRMTGRFRRSWRNGMVRGTCNHYIRGGQNVAWGWYKDHNRWFTYRVSNCFTLFNCTQDIWGLGVAKSAGTQKKKEFQSKLGCHGAADAPSFCVCGGAI